MPAALDQEELYQIQTNFTSQPAFSACSTKTLILSVSTDIFSSCSARISGVIPAAAAWKENMKYTLV